MSLHTPSHAEKPRSRKGLLALAGLLLGLAAVAALAAAGFGYRFGWWPLRTAFTIAQAGAYVAAPGFVLSAAGLVLGRRSARGILVGLLGLAATLVVLVPAAQWKYAASVYPPINDITTNPQDPPLFQDMPGAGAYPGGETAAVQRAAYPDLQPLSLAMPPERAFALARALVEDRGWTIVAAQPEEGRIEAVATTLLYGFEDEVVIRIEPAEAGTVIDLRSRSRIGRGDLGTNAARIRSFLADLKERAE